MDVVNFLLLLLHEVFHMALMSHVAQVPYERPHENPGKYMHAAAKGPENEGT